MRSALTALLLVGALCAVGCSPEDEPAASDPTTTRESPTMPAEPVATMESTSDPQVSVPDVTGLRAGPATSTLNEIGLRVRRVDVTGTACRPRGLVLAQTPRAGTEVQTGRRVRIELNNGAMRDCGLAAGGAGADLQRVAKLFVRFARGKNSAPPADTPVTLLVGGEQTKVIPGEVQPRTRAWASCPTEGYYAGRTCPINPVRTIAEHVGPLAFWTETPGHACANPRPVAPGDVGATYSVSLTPDEGLDCTSWWAVELFVNDVGQVVAVNTVWAEP